MVTSRNHGWLEKLVQPKNRLRSVLDYAAIIADHIASQRNRKGFAFAVSVLGVGIAAELTYLIAPLRLTPSVLFFAAVVATAHIGKKGPSVVSILLASVLVDFLFVAPTFSLLESLADVVRLTVFSIVGLSIHHLVHRFRGVADRLQEVNEVLDARVQQRTAELTATNLSLAKEIEVRKQEEIARKEVEQGLRVALDDVEQALKEKEILLREMQHRVKNNLQVINSLLSLQRDRIPDPGYRGLFVECQQRVRAIALVHQRLCGAPNLSSVDLTAYFRQLVEELIHTYFVGPGDVSAQVVVDETALSIDCLVPCALIVNELVCNSLKYAFPNGAGEIRVEIHRQAGTICLTVADNGIGFSPDKRSTQHGIGLQIVVALVEQLGGSLEWTRQNGTAATISFPERN